MPEAIGGTRGARTIEPDASGVGAIPEGDIDRSAYLWLERYGAAAVAEARSRAAALRGNGDVAGADSWLRLIVAIEEMTRWRGS